VGDRRFAQIRREHDEVLAALDRLEASVRRFVSGGPDGGGGALVAAVGEFLRFHDARIAPHMRTEEEEIYPLLDRFLPPEVGSSAAMRQEHETAGALVGLLHRDWERLKGGAAEAASEIAAAAQDIVTLLRDHIRKEDHVVNPLLERLLREARRG
jgi:hemerythrin-like domain-containing protein